MTRTERAIHHAAWLRILEASRKESAGLERDPPGWIPESESIAEAIRERDRRRESLALRKPVAREQAA